MRVNVYGYAVFAVVLTVAGVVASAQSGVQVFVFETTAIRPRSMPSRPRVLEPASFAIPTSMATSPSLNSSKS